MPRFPTLPDAAWFFHASPHNYLSFRNDLPASGFMAATFASLKVPAGILALASPLLAFTLVPGTARVIRGLLRRVIHQDAALIETNVMDWHEYLMEWETDLVRFNVDGMVIFQTNVSPAGPLSLVIWIDNQYASLPPKGRLKFGSLPNLDLAWMEIRELSIQNDS